MVRERSNIQRMLIQQNVNTMNDGIKAFLEMGRSKSKLSDVVTKINFNSGLFSGAPEYYNDAKNANSSS